MKRGAPSSSPAPLADRLPRPRSAAATSGWISTTAAAAPEPLFRTGTAMLEEAEVERRVADRLAQARGQAEREGWQKAEADVAAAIARLGDGLAQVHAVARAMVRPYSTELVELALLVARGLVGAEIARDPEPLVRLIERCLDEVAGESSITVRLHPSDRAALLAARPDLARADMRILEDASLARGGCAVESARRLVDARVEERLDNVRDGLRQLLEEAERADG